jgi:hypothetical protein
MATRALSILFCVFSMVNAVWGNGVSTSMVFQKEKLPPLMNCLSENLKGAKFDARKADQTFYRIKYWYGIFQPKEDKSNTLYLLIIHKDQKAATLYVLSPEKKNGKDNYLLGNVGMFNKQNGQFVLEEAFGGLATYEYLQEIVDAVSKEPEIMVPILKGKSNECSCEDF